MSYAINKQRARTRTTKPTLTDQSQAKDTDINIIVRTMGITGTVPTPSVPPMGGDFTKFPTDLRGFIEESREMKNRRRALPKELRDMPIEELLALTPNKLTAILTPPVKEKPVEKKDESVQGNQSTKGGTLEDGKTPK